MKKIFFLLCFSWTISICEAQPTQTTPSSTDAIKEPAKTVAPIENKATQPAATPSPQAVATPAPIIAQPSTESSATKGNDTNNGEKVKKPSKPNNGNDNSNGNSNANTVSAPVVPKVPEDTVKLAPSTTSTETTLKSAEAATIDSLERKIGILNGNVNEKYSLAVLLSLIGVIVGLLIGLIVVIFKSEDLKSTIKRLRGERDQLDYKNATLQGLINDNSKSSNNANSQQQSTTAALIRDLETENATLKEKLASALASKENEQNNANNPTVIIAPAKVYYFSTPQSDGSFNDSNKADMFTPTSSMYKFTLLSNTKAHFEFINDESTLKDAINYPDTYLLPVCRAENARSTKATKITTIGKGGIAELNNGRWEVKEKAVIRYE